ncbi:PQQ-dependent sugar dehydrogenase [Membranihabitans maritimus]|uniref:PQQ-dependent sugar dehydrogenase n=1 Tax=Membranihabitans maritimus TaxID=2904244 RepID=UPI001F16065B|nr:PQQ-dependent sugar dehydrogenase [Membranihabitans maritimus]
MINLFSNQMYTVTISIFTILLFSCDSNTENSHSESYIVEDISLPEGLTGEVGGLDFLPNGNLIACFHRGEIMTYDLETKEWNLFAYGLHDPLGIQVINNSEILVMQQPELTRIVDTDGDGSADLYETVTDDFGLSGNYHEFNYGPVLDTDGNIYIALNTASSGAGFKEIVRGELDLRGMDGKDGKKQMYSVVPYRGWMMQISKEGDVKPFAYGLRSPNGLGFDQDGNLFVADNQGDWVSTSALYHIQENNFYGHPASLVWKEDWTGGNPFETPIGELDGMRTKASVLFPQGIMANSPSQPLFDPTNGRFGPFAGQLFIGEMNRERIVRVMLEEVNGQIQGACVPFMDNKGLRKGNNRLAFAPDGSLWVGQTEHGWAGAKGIQRIRYTGTRPFEVYSVNLTKDGFDLNFTTPVSETVFDSAQIQIRHYFYDYYKKDLDEPVDKSIQVDVQEVAVSDLSVSRDGKKLSLELPELKAGYIYEFKLGNLKSADGKILENNLICYTLNHLK